MRDYGTGIPPIQAHVGELNEVWTNFIDNAVEAVDGKGVLRLSARAEQEDVVIDVGDTGPGMPPGWPPAQRHGGTIAIDSRPGRTILRIRIPVRLPSPSI